MGRLFWKFFFISWLALLATGIGVGSAVWWRHQLQEQQQHSSEMPMIDRHADLLVETAAEILRHGGEQALTQFLHRPRDRPFPPVYAIDAEGHDLLNRDLDTGLLEQIRNYHSQEGDDRAIRKVSSADGRQYLLFVLLPKHRIENAIPRAMFPPPPPPLHPHEHQPGRRPPPQNSPWMPIVSGTLASLLLSAALAWYFAKPIRLLRNAFAAAADGKLDTRVAATMGKRHDELADLGRDFDHMAAQLDALLTAQQRLLNDVSHELRSPLARIQAAIGLAQQQPDKIPQTMERIERESQRISDLIGELLVLSRLEAGVDKSELADTELSGLLWDIVEDARFEAKPNGITVNYRGIDEVIAKTRGELLHRAVENVVRNAVRHCKTGGNVEVGADFDASVGRLRIAIDDQGPGVPEADLQAIFQPFFRSKRHTRSDSVGLGLTIAYRAIETLGGTIQAANRPEGGLHVAIELPIPRS